MLILDDLLFKLPLKGVLWIAGKIQQVVEQELTNEDPVKEAILENELAFEEGRIDKETYEAAQAALFARLREIREAKRALAEERAREAGLAGGEARPAEAERPGISGKASLEIDLDLDGYGSGR